MGLLLNSPSQEVTTQMLSEKEQEKARSKKLKEKIHACISSFQKVGTAVKEALEQGRKVGFTDKEIGKMIREEMLRAGLTRQTVNNYLPKSAKAKPRRNSSGRLSEPRFSKKFLPNEAVVLPELPQPETIVEEENILAKENIEEHKQQMDAVENVPVPESSAVDMQHVTPSKLQSAYIELDPTEDEYDIENLENYSRSMFKKPVTKESHGSPNTCV
jgi:hypothetical protein